MTKVLFDIQISNRKYNTQCNKRKYGKRKLSLIIIPSEIVYILGAWYNIFIQILKIICTYSSHQGGAI